MKANPDCHSWFVIVFCVFLAGLGAGVLPAGIPGYPASWRRWGRFQTLVIFVLYIVIHDKRDSRTATGTVH